MTFAVKPGKYLIEKTRRNVVGVIAHVGTGGSVPSPVQAALDAYADSLAAGGSDPKHERATIRSGMKQMAGTWLLISPAGLRWADGGADAQAARRAIRTMLRNSGWNVPTEQLDALLG